MIINRWGEQHTVSEDTWQSVAARVDTKNAPDSMRYARACAS